MGVLTVPRSQAYCERKGLARYPAHGQVNVTNVRKTNVALKGRCAEVEGPRSAEDPSLKSWSLFMMYTLTNETSVISSDSWPGGAGGRKGLVLVQRRTQPMMRC